MVQDMVSLLGCSTRFDARYNLLRAAVAKDKAAARTLRAQLAGAGGEGPTLELVQRELAGRRGFLPLMQHFPVREAFDQGYALPWGARDYRLSEWMEQNPEAWGGNGGGVGAGGGGAAAGASSRSSSETNAAGGGIGGEGGASPMEVS
jgi:hypothetical protein